MDRKAIYASVSTFHSEEPRSDSDSVLFLCEAFNDRSGKGSVESDINLAERHLGSNHQ